MKKRKDGLYASQVYLGMVDGKKKYKTVYGKTQREVKTKVAELKIQQGKGVNIAALDETFGAWADRHKANKANSGVSFSCLQGLNTNLSHLEPLWDYKLSDITVPHAQDIINYYADWHEGKPPMSKRSLNSLKQVMRDVFRQAIISRIVEFNPADYIVIPKNAAETQRTALSDEQQNWVRQTPCEGQMAAMLMLYAGLRRGELLALTWNDINLTDGTITVLKAVEYKNGKPELKSTKTAAGQRVIKIPALLIEFLKIEKEKTNSVRIICGKDGGIPKLTSWRNFWKRYMQHLNLVYGYGGDSNGAHIRDLDIRIETFTPHQLRHTFATLLYMAGIDVLTARDQLGHTDIKTTLGVYTHLDKKYKKESMNRLDEYLCQYDVSNEDKKITL